MRWQTLGLAVALAVPSLGHFFKFAGIILGLLYVCGVLWGGWFLLPGFIGWLRGRFSERGSRNLALLVLLLLALVFVFVYPLLNVQSGYKGSDRDDDADIATQELLAGRYPYYKTTYLGNGSSHFPGSLFLCAPFVFLTGKSAWQNIFWLLMLLLLLKRYYKNWHTACALFIFTLCASPLLWYEVLTGGDLVANSIYVFIFFFLFTEAAISSPSRWRRTLFWGALLGVGLSSRLYFLFLLPPFFIFCLYNIGWKKAFGYWLWVGIVFLAVNLPFYFYDPQNFMPLKNQWLKVGALRSGGISFSSIYMGLTMIIGFLTAFLNRASSYSKLFINCILVLALFTVGYSLFGVFQRQLTPLAALNLSYGFAFSIFALFALRERLVRDASA